MKNKSLLIKILVLALTTGAFSQYTIVFKNGTPTYIFTSYDILNGPYKDLNTLLSTLPGINGLGDYSDRPQIRGSDFREMQVIMDGMILTDQITNAPFLNVPLGIIDTLEVIPGGFGAEYGNARSGIVKIKTKQGGDKLHVQANMRYSPAGLKHFGPMAYGKDSPIVIPFVEESAGAFTGNEVFEGWNSYANHTLQSDDPHYGKPYETFALYLWRHRSPNNLNKLYNIVNQGLIEADLSNLTNDDAFFEYGTTPDWQGEYNLSGPVPFLPKAQHPDGYIYDENGKLIDINGNWSWAGNETYDVPAFRNEFLTCMNSLKIEEGDRPGDYPHDGKKRIHSNVWFYPVDFFLEKRDIFFGIRFNL